VKGDTIIPFKERLKHTIAQLERETEEGLEDWTPTIERLKEVLKEEEENEAQGAVS
jgi:hypothetical protein